MTPEEEAIREFVKTLLGELSGTDNGVDWVLDDYDNDNIEAYMDYYLKERLHE